MAHQWPISTTAGDGFIGHTVAGGGPRSASVIGGFWTAAAADATLKLYDGDPGAGGTLVLPLAAKAGTTVEISSLSDYVFVNGCWVAVTGADATGVILTRGVMPA